MARSRYKASGATAGRFKPKKMGKGWSTNRKTPIGNRPVLRITEPDDDADGDAKADESKDGDGNNEE